MMGSMSPVAVTNVTGATSLSTGGDQQGTWCALFYNVVRCWGYNAVGQLGDGTTTDSLTPVPTQW
jgi:hypothetical protein